MTKADLFSNFSAVSSRQDGEVGSKGTSLHSLVVDCLVILSLKQNVVAQSSILNPGLLGHIGHFPLRTAKFRCEKEKKEINEIRAQQEDIFLYLDVDGATLDFHIPEHGRAEGRFA